MKTLSGKIFGSLAVVLILVLGGAGCSKGSDAGGSALGPDTKKANAALNAGLKAQSSGDLTTAAKDYARTLQYDPNNKFAYYNLALIDAARSNYGLAEVKYRKALESDPKYEPALFNLAILRTGPDPKEATSLYRRAVASNPKDASAWLNLGLLLRASGEKAQGDLAVAKALKLNPKLVDPAKGKK